MAVSVVGATGSVAPAQVVDWDFVKAIGHEQTANDTAPGAPVLFIVDSFIDVTTSADLDAATLDGSLSYMRALDNAEEFDYFDEFGSLAALNSAFGDGTMHEIEISGGTLGTLTQSFTIPTIGFPTAAPYLTGDSYDRLQSMNPLDAISLTMNSPASAGAGEFLYQIERILPGGETELILETGIADPNATEFEIAAGLLDEGATYQLIIGHLNVTPYDADPSGFNAEARFIHGSFTFIEFTTVPTPGSAALATIAVGLVLMRRHTR